MICCPNRIILTDVDDTLLRFDAAFTSWMIRQHGYTPTMPLHEARNVEELFGITLEEACPFIAEFYRTPEFENIEPLACAADVVPALQKEGYRFVAITACEIAPEIETARRKNLRNAFGFDFEDVHMTGLFVPRGKEPTLSQYKSTLWVEDNEGHAASGAVLGHNSVLLSRKRNEGFIHGNVRRVADWHEIAKLL